MQRHIEDIIETHAWRQPDGEIDLTYTLTRMVDRIESLEMASQDETLLMREGYKHALNDIRQEIIRRGKAKQLPYMNAYQIVEFAETKGIDLEEK